MKCKYCNGTGEHINDANRMTTCEFCGGTGVIKPLTNEEWFCGMSTEEKAHVFANATYSSAMMGAEICLLPKEDEVRKWNMWLKAPHDWKKWLKEKHEPLKNDEK